MLRLRYPRYAVVYLLLPLAACRDSVPTGAGSDVPRLARRATPTLLQCERSTSRSERRVIGRDGGSVSLGGHRLDVPRGAVRRPTTFTLTRPSSPTLRLEITADHREHFAFAKPARITISFAECSGQTEDLSGLSVWYVDDHSGRLLQAMAGHIDEKALTIAFPTRHLSTYAVAH